ncbi:Uncharacterised protein [Burkholderia cenocepacia]|nr:Uncharacterised protein [Burkholderia cenocepacia]
MAVHVSRAMTATPPSGWKPDGSGVAASCTTLTTPGSFPAADASNDATVSP